jgi:hypothetical protein
MRKTASNRRQSLTRASALALVLVCSPLPLGLAAAPGHERSGRLDDTRRCRRIEAKLTSVRVTENCTNPNGCFAGVITGDRLIRGTFRASAFGFVPSVGLPGVEPETTFSFAGERTIETPQGTLTLRFTGVFDTARGEFSELERLTDGTERFDGATGTLWLAGISNADATAFEAQITGQVCTKR